MQSLWMHAINVVYIESELKRREKKSTKQIPSPSFGLRAGKKLVGVRQVCLFASKLDFHFELGRTMQRRCCFYHNAQRFGVLSFVDCGRAHLIRWTLLRRMNDAEHCSHDTKSYKIIYYFIFFFWCCCYHCLAWLVKLYAYYWLQLFCTPSSCFFIFLCCKNNHVRWTLLKLRHSSKRTSKLCWRGTPTSLHSEWAVFS